MVCWAMPALPATIAEARAALRTFCWKAIEKTLKMHHLVNAIQAAGSLWLV
jgi:hypothetical protein